VRLRFGTDGVRGIANRDLCVQDVLELGRAVASVIREPIFLVGRDPRRSGTMLSAALCAGIASAGADVVDLGVIPTPGVAVLAKQRDCAACVVSASHNPYMDNGVKVFAKGGRKLDPSTEREIEAFEPNQEPSELCGVITSHSSGVREYTSWLVDTVGKGALAGISVALDTANGATAPVAREVFERLGARVVSVIGDEANGVNINAGCGSTSPERLQQEVVARNADLGLAFDGDGDRVVAVDHEGNVVDGDAMIALFAFDMDQRQLLAKRTVVVTVMSNLGLVRSLQSHGIEVSQTPVGDRHVLEVLDAGGYSLGGEQSGHIVFSDLAPSGDGLLTGALLCSLVLRRGEPLATLAASAMARLPQAHQNVKLPEEHFFDESDPGLRQALESARLSLGDDGRVLVRPSGTEPVVRVMVEAPSAEKASMWAKELGAAVQGAMRPATDKADKASDIVSLSAQAS
jgi:phosphoglucosamine mutase